MTIYTLCGNIYTIRFVKFNLDHKMDPLDFTLNEEE